MLRDRLQPGVVLGGVLAFGRGQKLDHAADGALVVEDLAVVVGADRRVGEPVGEVVVEDGGDGVEIAVDVGHVGVAEDERVGDRLGDLRLSPAGDGARLVAAGGRRHGTDQAPLGTVGGLLDHRDLVAVGREVVLVGSQLDLTGRAVGVLPGDVPGAQRVRGTARYEHDVRLFGVQRVAFGLQTEPLRVSRQHLGEVVADVAARRNGVFLPQVVAGEDEGPTGVLLLGVAEQIRRVRDLGLDLFLAVAEVVVGDHGDDHAAGVPCAHLEGLATVVPLVVGLPAQAVSLLPGRGDADVRQAEALLGHRHQVRSEDDRPGVPRPRLGCQRCVVLGQVGIATVAEDAFDEVEVRHESAGDDEAGLHALLADVAGHGRGDQRTQLQRHETGGRLGLVGGVGQNQILRRRLERQFQQAREHRFGDGDLVVGNGQPALGDVEHAGRGPPVVGRVVQNAVREAVAGQQG